MELEEIIFESILGIFLIYTSYQMGIKGNITLLHGYHYRNIDPDKKDEFAKRVGLGNFFVGLGVLVIPVLNMMTSSELGDYIGLGMIIIGIVLMIIYIIIYNGNLISFKKR